jgi:hypothetical protein
MQMSNGCCWSRGCSSPSISQLKRHQGSVRNIKSSCKGWRAGESSINFFNNVLLKWCLHFVWRLMMICLWKCSMLVGRQRPTDR